MGVIITFFSKFFTSSAWQNANFYNIKSDARFGFPMSWGAKIYLYCLYFLKILLINYFLAEPRRVATQKPLYLTILLASEASFIKAINDKLCNNLPLRRYYISLIIHQFSSLNNI